MKRSGARRTGGRRVAGNRRAGRSFGTRRPSRNGPEATGIHHIWVFNPWVRAEGAANGAPRRVRGAHMARSCTFRRGSAGIGIPAPPSVPTIRRLRPARPRRAHRRRATVPRETRSRASRAARLAMRRRGGAVPRRPAPSVRARLMGPSLRDLERVSDAPSPERSSGTQAGSSRHRVGQASCLPVRPGSHWLVGARPHELETMHQANKIHVPDREATCRKRCGPLLVDLPGSWPR